MRGRYLDELCRHDGRGDQIGQVGCMQCNGTAVFRCLDCYDNALYCSSCIVKLHQRNPLHLIQVRAYDGVGEAHAT